MCSTPCRRRIHGSFALFEDKDKKSPWITQFHDLNPATVPVAQWKVKKDGGQIAYHTGATISARAVTNAVARAARYAADNQNRLFAAASGSRAIGVAMNVTDEQAVEI